MAENTIVGGPKDGHRTKAYGTFAADQPLNLLEINRRYPIKAHDVLVDILYCGVCHSDIHTARNEWPGTIYPVIPGHEIVGVVKEIGTSVGKFKVGDKCAVGVFVSSCGNCTNCKAKLDQYCCEGAVFTYNSKDEINEPGCVTYGGYSTQIVVNEHYVLRWPDNLPMDQGAPLLCAGITVYSPLRYLNVGPGSRVGVVGLGGLGHIAVRLAHAMGAFVCVFSRGGSEKKKQLSKDLGADMFVATGDGSARLDCGEPFDVIIDTVSADHNVNQLIRLLKFDGTYAMVGLPPDPVKLAVSCLVMHRRHIMGSMIGSTEETQSLLDFCSKHNIVCMTETIKMEYINEAYERILKSDVNFRFVIDIKGSAWQK